MYYPAFLLPAVEGGYTVVFPDLPEAFTQGDTLEEALALGQEVLAIAVEEYAAIGKPFPAPSSGEMLQTRLREAMQGEGLDASREALVQLFAEPEPDAALVRPAISMPKGALKAIDAKATRLGMNRSDFLMRAVEAYSS